VVIDHQDGEWSALFHFRRGSLRVELGKSVAPGDVLGIVGSAGTPGYPHLHYNLQDGPDFWQADGLPSCFEGVELATDILGPMRRGAAVATPLRGFYLLAR
jgi:murein DD-endopeptidase MepM/ murein hydrolase activator NlpD